MQACFLALDEAAATLHRQKRAKAKQKERKAEDDVVSCLLGLLSAVCRKEEQDKRLWRCPGGCASGDPDCARMAFRV